MSNITNHLSLDPRDSVHPVASNLTLLAGRVLLVVLFVQSGWGDLTDFRSTVLEMAGFHLPLPVAAAGIATFMEFFVGGALALGFHTRRLAVLLAIYTLMTALIGHHYWTMSGADYVENQINFFKNISIIGGLLLLAVAGGGSYSLDRALRRN